MIKRKLVCGVGINDSKYVTYRKVGDIAYKCPFYSKWSAMIERCYSPASRIARPAYNDCTVCDEWLLFSNFKEWMIEQDWKDKELDKDIISQGNKIYSPENCLFVTARVNKLLNKCAAARGKYKLGVSYCKREGKFISRCSDGGENTTHIGYFDNEDDAHEAYKTFKYKVIAKVAEDQDEPLRTALLNYKIKEVK